MSLFGHLQRQKWHEILQLIGDLELVLSLEKLPKTDTSTYLKKASSWMSTHDIFTKCVPYFGEWMCILFEDLDILTIADKLKCLRRICVSSKPQVGRLREQVRSHRGRARASALTSTGSEQTSRLPEPHTQWTNRQTDKSPSYLWNRARYHTGQTGEALEQ